MTDREKLLALATALAGLFLSGCEEPFHPSERAASVRCTVQFPPTATHRPDSVTLQLHRPADGWQSEQTIPVAGGILHDIPEGTYSVTAYTAIHPTLPLYHGQTTATIVADGDQPQTLSVLLRCISQQLNLLILLTRDNESIAIDSVCGVLTGLCRHMNVGRQTVELSPTVKTTIKAQPIATAGTTLYLQATTSTLGLVSSANPQLTVGPGLFTLTVHTHRLQSHRTFSYQLNLHQELTANPSLTYDGTLSAFRLATDTLTLQLSRWPVITYEAKDSNHDTWLESSDIELEI